MKPYPSSPSFLCVFTAAVLLLPKSATAQMPDPPGQVKDGSKPKHMAYLFAHMVHDDYGRLYYSVSRDGLHWERLNDGKRVFEEYRGHADICQGHDGRYFLVGNRSDAEPEINFWVSVLYEQYPGVAYGLSVATSLKGPWFQVAGGTQYRDWDKYSLPPKARHGSMRPITLKEYDALVAAFGKGGTP